MQGYEKTGKQRKKMSDLISSVYKRVKENIGRVIVGKEEVVDLMLVTLFAGGHMLIEDVPGTGKTELCGSCRSLTETICSASIPLQDTAEAGSKQPMRRLNIQKNVRILTKSDKSGRENRYPM